MTGVHCFGVCAKSWSDASFVPLESDIAAFPIISFVPIDTRDSELFARDAPGSDFIPLGADCSDFSTDPFGSAHFPLTAGSVLFSRDTPVSDGILLALVRALSEELLGLLHSAVVLAPMLELEGIDEDSAVIRTGFVST